MIKAGAIGEFVGQPFDVLAVGGDYFDGSCPVQSTAEKCAAKSVATPVGHPTAGIVPPGSVLEPGLVERRPGGDAYTCSPLAGPGPFPFHDFFVSFQPACTLGYTTLAIKQIPNPFAGLWIDRVKLQLFERITFTIFQYLHQRHSEYL